MAKITDTAFIASFTGAGIAVSPEVTAVAFTLENGTPSVVNGGPGHLEVTAQAAAAARALRDSGNGTSKDALYVAIELPPPRQFGIDPSLVHLFYSTTHGGWIVARDINIQDGYDTLKDNAVVEDTNVATDKYMTLIHSTEQQDIDIRYPALRYDGVVAYCATVGNMRRFDDATQRYRVYVPPHMKNMQTAADLLVGVSVHSFRQAARDIGTKMYAVAMFSIHDYSVLERLSARPWTDAMCNVWRDPSDKARGKACLQLVHGGPGMAPVPRSYKIHELENISDAETQDPMEMEKDPKEMTADEALFATRLLADFPLTLKDGVVERIHRSTMYIKNPLLGLLIHHAHLTTIKLATLDSLSARTVLSLVYTEKITPGIRDEWLRLGPEIPDISRVAMARAFAHLAGVGAKVDSELVRLYCARMLCLSNCNDIVALLELLTPLDMLSRRILAPFVTNPSTVKHAKIPEGAVYMVTESTQIMTAIGDTDAFVHTVMTALLAAIINLPNRVTDHINVALQRARLGRHLADELEKNIGDFVGVLKKENHRVGARAEADWVILAIRMVFSYPNKVPGIKVVDNLADIRDLDVEFYPKEPEWTQTRRKTGIIYKPKEVTHRPSTLQKKKERPQTPPGFWDLEFPDENPKD